MALAQPSDYLRVNMSKSKYRELLARVADLAKQTNRPPAKVVVVSKTRTVEEIMDIYE